MTAHLQAQLLGDLPGQGRHRRGLDSAGAGDVDVERGRYPAGPRGEHQDPVGQPDGLAHIVGDEEHGEAAVAPEALELGVEQVSGHGVQRTEGLVHEQDVGILGQGPGQSDPLAHAARQLRAAWCRTPRGAPSRGGRPPGAAAPRLRTPRRRRARATLPATVSQGNRAASWNIKAVRPSTVICPAVGEWPASRWSIVLFPHPEAPTRHTNSRPTWRLMRSRAWIAWGPCPNTLLTTSTRTTAAPDGGAAVLSARRPARSKSRHRGFVGLGQEPVQDVQGVDAREVDRVQKARGHRVVGGLAEGRGDGVPSEREVLPGAGDHLVGEPLSGDGLDAVVDHRLRLGGVGIGVLDCLDQPAQEALHDVGVLLEELGAHDQMGGDVEAVGQQVAFVNENDATSLLDEAGGPGLRHPGAVDVARLEHGEGVGVRLGEDRNVASAGTSKVSPCSSSQARRATSWVLPSCGVASLVPTKSCGVKVSSSPRTSGRTTRKAPPEVEPPMMRMASPPDWA